MDQKRIERIIGLLFGIAGYFILFWFKFEDFEFDFSYIRYSIIGSLGYMIGESDTMSWFWIIMHLIYFPLIWYYRACVGFWFFKMVKKI